MGLERGPLSLVSIVEELLERKNSRSLFSAIPYNLMLVYVIFQRYNIWNKLLQYILI
jgi:hypothetical protein